MKYLVTAGKPEWGVCTVVEADPNRSSGSYEAIWDGASKIWRLYPCRLSKNCQHIEVQDDAIVR